MRHFGLLYLAQHNPPFQEGKLKAQTIAVGDSNIWRADALIMYCEQKIHSQSQRLVIYTPDLYFVVFALGG